MTLRIGFVYDLRGDYLAEGYSEEATAEFDSETTIEGIESALRSMGHCVERIGHARELCRRLAGGQRWDLVFNMAEGVRGRGREAQAPCLLELYNIPYTFSDPLVCAVTLDKAVAKRLVHSFGLRTPAFRVVESDEDLADLGLTYPLFAKPIAEGTGKGVGRHSRVADAGQLRAVCADLLKSFEQPVLVEEYLPGREFTTGILGSGRDTRALGTMEVCIRAGAPSSDYTYEVKENYEQYVEYPLLEPGALRDDVELLALNAYRALECRDAGRVDIRLDAGGRPSFMEVNPLPGLHPVRSDLPILARSVGMRYEDLIGGIVNSAARRLPKRRDEKG